MYPNQARKWLGPEYGRTTKMIDEAHFTWVGPYCPALERQPKAELTERAAALVRRMGYQFAIHEFRHPRVLASGEKLTVSLNGENEGVAPFYYAWPVELVPLDSQGTLVERLPVDWDIRQWLPEKFQSNAAPVVKAKAGEYQLGLGIRDPWTDLPTIAFANSLPRSGGWTIVSRIEVR